MLHSDLMTWLETHFHCMTGPPRAYFEIPIRPVSRGEHDPQDFLRVVYRTIGFQMLANTPDLMRKAQDKLLERMLQEFKDAHAVFEEGDTPLLFWRRLPKFIMEQGFARLDCRVAIPGYEFERRVQPDEGYKFPMLETA